MMINPLHKLQYLASPSPKTSRKKIKLFDYMSILGKAVQREVFMFSMNSKGSIPPVLHSDPSPRDLAHFHCKFPNMKLEQETYKQMIGSTTIIYASALEINLGLCSTRWLEVILLLLGCDRSPCIG